MDGRPRAWPRCLYLATYRFPSALYHFSNPHCAQNPMFHLDQLNDTLGCMFIGISLALVLYGLSMAQTQFYFHRYTSDRLSLKALVAFLWLLDTARTSCGLHFLWVCVVENHANTGMRGMLRFTVTFISDAFLGTLTIAITQLYYIHTIWHLMSMAQGHRRCRLILITIMVLLVLLSFCSGVVSVYGCWLRRGIAASMVDVKVTSSMQTITAFITDAYLAIALSIIFHRQRTGCTRSGSDLLIRRLMTFALQRGIVTVYVLHYMNKFLEFVTYAATLHSGSSKLIWTLFYFPASKVYTNSLLAMLNLRHWLRGTSIVDYVELGIAGAFEDNSLSPKSSHLLAVPGAQPVVARGAVSASMSWHPDHEGLGKGSSTKDSR
ncbi:uncharacterized protein C8Q71DRAFT_790287 [Rhodofomes roseus]|uniref:DUF6534 domain-containing protein n=1 Tax=Rhodofomes roseus TaxID=34475 RepID=A0ABQ8JZE7_9APHY|nr:uncharacterized protein C8Q71DRAFT_790287 [Rhodofomes roseus]KAH9829456.1 hypothetical protein C8Q71DRAFT_790287 [Rhodofomes roseus]